MTNTRNSQIMLSEAHGRILRNGAEQLRQFIESTVATFRSRVGHIASIPKDLEVISSELSALLQALEPGSRVGQVSPLEARLAPIIVATVLRDRRRCAEEVEAAKSRITDVHVIARLQVQLQPYNELMQQEWFSRTKPLRVPSLDQFLTPDESRIMKPPPANDPVTYEDKFRILRAASDIMSSLNDVRSNCEHREVNFAVCFLDIDNLKQLNERLGEPTVDIYVLPTFFRTIDRGIYGHGTAFRHGGDEVVLLLPNSDRELACAIVARIAAEVRQANFVNIDTPPTISAGIVVVSPDSWLTNWEIIDVATKAKKSAKQAGKNSVALGHSHSASETPFDIVSLGANVSM